MNDLFKKDCITTFTKKYVNVFNPKPEMFCIEDIAHALSKEQRFGNQLRENYSVAQHCIICSEMANAEDKLTALLHDASEAYIRDLPKPIKIKVPQYEQIEDNLMKCLSVKFGFQYPLPQTIHDIDSFMLEKEWNSLMMEKEPFGYAVYSQHESKVKFIECYNMFSNAKS